MLEQNVFTVKPQHFSRLQNLKVLKISNESEWTLTNICDVLRQLQQLETLVLSQISLEALADPVCSCSWRNNSSEYASRQFLPLN